MRFLPGVSCDMSVMVFALLLGENMIWRDFVTFGADYEGYD